SSWGGLEMVAYEYAISLTQNNFQCHTLCIENSPLHQHLRALGLPTFTLNPKWGTLNFLKLRNFIQSEGIEIVLVQLLKDLRLLALSIMNQSKVNMFAVSHTFVDVNKKDFLHRWSYRKLEKLICLTHLHKENLLQNLPLREKQIEVLPNFVDCKRFTPQKRSEDLRKKLGGLPGIPLIGVASRLDPQKGQDTALQAVALLKERKREVRLVIVGENTLNEKNYLAELKQMTRDLEIQDWVHFSGYRADMENVMASLDVLVMPSHRETFGRVLIEAMASNTPVIATNAGGVPEIIESHKNGLLIPPQKPQELAEAIEKLIVDPELHRTLAQGGYFKVRSTFDREVVENKLLELLNSSR
ncbi:MAG: glycosyltransferase family 4 protein, partial [Pseudobdellovibrionaceae bacterium]